MMKSKFKIISSDRADKWVLPANLFAKSQCPLPVVIKQFNALSSRQRNDIVKLFREYDEIRRAKIPKDDATDDAWITCVMVDAHIIATEYNVDPLTVIMCIGAPCKSNEKVVVK